MTRLMRELYDFSHAPIGQAESIPLNDLVAQAAARAKMELPDNLRMNKTLREELAERLPQIHGQPERITRAIVNVLLNAYEYTPAGGVILVAHLHFATGRQRGRFCDLRGLPRGADIFNPGTPISPENQRQVFEPFFSTKQGGTGLSGHRLPNSFS